MKFSLIIPCYNEAANLPALLDRCGKLVAALGEEIEVVIVDNGSRDDTQAILAQLLPQYSGIRVVKVEVNKGYGFGIVSGLRSCTTDIIGWTHADLQTDPMDVVEAVKIFKANEGDVFVKGKRYGRPLGDQFFTFGMSVFETLLLKTGLWDINAQPTMFTRSSFEQWENPPDDFSLDLYAYFMAKHRNAKVFRIRVLFGERAHGVSHWNVDWASKKKFIKRTVDFSLELKKRLKQWK